jgi:hypothetical protein
MADGSTAGNRAPGSDPGSVSSTLLERLKARRPEAWQRLVDLYGPVVYRCCRWSGVWALSCHGLGPNGPVSKDLRLFPQRRVKPAR